MSLYDAYLVLAVHDDKDKNVENSSDRMLMDSDHVGLRSSPDCGHGQQQPTR